VRRHSIPIHRELSKLYLVSVRVRPFTLVELSWVSPYLAIGPKPEWAAWAAFEKAGISLVIDLNDDALEKHQAKHLGMQYKGLKVPDPTELRDFQNAFPVVHQWIENERTTGGKVYLHCTAGVYRSPTFAMAHLMKRGQSAKEAEKVVKKAHKLTWTSGDTETLQRALHLWRETLPAEAP
jgi:protein-tyrosine phosphatase